MHDNFLFKWRVIRAEVVMNPQPRGQATLTFLTGSLRGSHFSPCSRPDFPHLGQVTLFALTIAMFLALAGVFHASWR